MLVTTLSLAAVAFCAVARIVYLLWLHPLAKYPGPLLARITNFHGAYYAWKGEIHLRMYQDHQKYGDIVRCGPNIVLVNSAAGLHDIYSTSATSNFTKSDYYKPLEHKLPSTFTARERKDHLWRRRILAQTLSDKAQRGYEPRIASHITKLCDIFFPEGRKAGTWSEPLDMSKWCHWLTFDIMADIVFSAYYNLLGSDRFRYVPNMIEQTNQRMSVLMPIHWVAAYKFHRYLFKNSSIASYRFLKFVDRCIRERIERGCQLIDKQASSDTDPTSGAIKGGAGGDVFEILANGKDANTGESFDRERLFSESITLIAAGSETSSTALVALLFYLADNKEVYDHVAKEVRNSSGETGLASCTYLRACIDEALRMSPPNGAALPRVVINRSGAVVDNKYLASGCNAGVCIYSLHHDARYFADPFTYRPERWLVDDGTGDSIERARSAFCPFSIGARSCVGKSLAYDEITRTIASILLRGDFRIADGELGRVGRGTPGDKHGRHREKEFQMRDHIVSQTKGPWLQFTPRAL